MESLVKHFGAGLIAMAVLVAIAVVVIGIVKSDGVTAQFQDTLTAFFTSIRNAAGF
jgi:ABC-type transporter Mla subunit MlaD